MGDIKVYKCDLIGDGSGMAFLCIMQNVSTTGTNVLKLSRKSSWVSAVISSVEQEVSAKGVAFLKICGIILALGCCEC